jgi:excisionase family DNA binding protein
MVWLERGMGDWLTVTEAAQLLGYHPNHLRRLLRKGAVSGWKRRNRQWAISRKEVERVKGLQTDRGRYYPNSAWLSW